MISKTFGIYDVRAIKPVPADGGGYMEQIVGEGHFKIPSCNRRSLYAAFRTQGINLPKGCDFACVKVGESVERVTDEYFLAGSTDSKYKNYELQDRVFFTC